MQFIIVFVFLFCLRTVSLAADVTIYNRFNEYHAEPGTESKPIAEYQFPWKFSYCSGDWLFISIYWKNLSPTVTAVTVTYRTEFGTFLATNDTVSKGPRRGEEYYHFSFDRILNFTEIEIVLNLYKSNISCSSVLVAKGRMVVNISNEAVKYHDILTKHGCKLVVDLINQCDDHPLFMNTTTENTVTTVETIHPNTNTITYNSSTNLEITTNKTSAADTEGVEQQSSLNIVLLYVMPAVIGMCVVILLIYLLWFKKYCHRNSQPVETTELNTYVTANEVVYADLSFVHGDSQPPRYEEESTYAQIVGVLKPDGNVKNK